MTPRPLVIDQRPVSTALLVDVEIPEFEGDTNADLYDYAMTLREELRICRADKNAEKVLVELVNGGDRQGRTPADR